METMECYVRWMLPPDAFATAIGSVDLSCVIAATNTVTNVRQPKPAEPGTPQNAQPTPPPIAGMVPCMPCVMATLPCQCICMPCFWHTRSRTQQPPLHRLASLCPSPERLGYSQGTHTGVLTVVLTLGYCCSPLLRCALSRALWGTQSGTHTGLK